METGLESGETRPAGRLHLPPAPAPTAVPGWAVLAAIAAVYSLLAVLVFWPVWSGHPTSDMQLGGDQWRNVWFLAWIAYAIGHGHNPLFSVFANVPVGVNLLSAGGIPLLGLVFSPVTVIWGPVASYNVACTAALASSALAAYALLRRFTSWRPAAFLGGLFYGFSPPVMTQSLGHLNLAFVPLPPLILLLLHELLARQRWSPRLTGVLLGAGLAAQFLVSPEILLDTVIVAVIAVIAAAVAYRKELPARLPRSLTGLAWAAGSTFVLLAYPVWFMLAGPAHVSGKINLVPQAYRADLLGPLLPDSNQLLTVHGRLLRAADRFATSSAENGSYLGVTLLAFLAASVVALRRHRLVVVAGIAGVCAFVLSLGGTLAVKGAPSLGADGTAGAGTPLPGVVMEHIPVVDNVVPARFALLVALCAAVVFAYALDRLRANLAATRGSAAVGLGVAAVCLFPVIPVVPIPGIANSGTPAWFSSSAVKEIPAGSTALLFPFPSGAYPSPSLWQAQVNFRFRMVAGDFLVPQGPLHHVAYSPVLSYTADSLTGETLTRLQEGDPPAETPQLRAGVLAEVAAWRVDRVVALPARAARPRAADAFLRWLFGPPASDSKGTEIWVTGGTRR